MAIPLPIMQKKKKIYFGNCGNPIADNVKKKKKKFILAIVAIPLPIMLKKKKKFILAIVAIPLPKMEKNNYEIFEWVKKKLSRPQSFHNKSHVINYY